MRNPRVILTYRDYEALPADGRRYEVHEGELSVTPASSPPIVQPDLVYLDSTHLSAVSARGIEGPPTLVVEILSPATTVIDRSTRRQLYARYGVPFFRIVDPEARALTTPPPRGAGAPRPG